MRYEDWGLVDYAEASTRQLERVDQVAAGIAPEAIVFCSHPPVVTLGRATQPGDLLGWRGATLETTRGGRATYHGPSQLVIYPILDLRPRNRDVHAYLRGLETATVAALHEFGLPAVEARTTKQGEISLTGVWIGRGKLASIGIAVRKWITYHGVALNVFEDPLAFQGIRPCGFSADTMTNVERELGSRPNLAALREQVENALTRQFEPL